MPYVDDFYNYLELVNELFFLVIIYFLFMLVSAENSLESKLKIGDGALVIAFINGLLNLTILYYDTLSKLHFLFVRAKTYLVYGARTEN